MFASLLLFGTGLGLFFGLAILLILIFEIWMFVDAFSSSGITSEKRLLWLIGMLLIHPFVAIAYYFTDHRKKQNTP